MRLNVWGDNTSAVNTKSKLYRGDGIKKTITIALEVESDDEYMMSDEFIKTDLEREINCASNFYDVVSINIISDTN